MHDDNQDQQQQEDAHSELDIADEENEQQQLESLEVDQR